jgi:NADH:ubiquinone oxidoreductase subunit F (NADH-binding)/NADH:ubiquinone oxidoreductase subunit E
MPQRLQRTALLVIVQELHRIQHDHGFLPEPELRRLAERTGTPLYRLQEVASFFPHFHLEPPPPVTVAVCRDMACHMRGALDLERRLDTALAADVGAGRVAVRHASCLGRCDRPVAVALNERLLASCGADGRTVEAIAAAARGALAGDPPAPDTDAHYACHTNRPWRIDPYTSSAGTGSHEAASSRTPYAAIDTFLSWDDPQRLVEELKKADLRGMGGAGVPAHQKWHDVRHAKGDARYVVCNADESEPGTFKDRELLTHHAHVVLEGVILAGLFTGATRGWIYVRHEYGEQIAIMKAEITRAEALGACGRNIRGSGRDFPVEVFTSPGGYICGEQSALIEAMEDHRAQPRPKPPQLETNGLYDRPTLVSNVETFAWAPAIVLDGGDWFASTGIRGCRGSRLFSVSGDVHRPGVYEVPNGTPLGVLIEEHCGGTTGPLKAFAPSGPSGGFLPARLPVSALPRGWEKRAPADLVAAVAAGGGTHVDILHLELDLQRFRDLGLALGAGLVVYDATRDMAAEALSCSRFFRDESCGKCVPCRIGSDKIVHVAEEITTGRISRGDLAARGRLVGELARALEMTSICGLGMVAAKPLETTLAFFRDDVERHLAANTAGGVS